MKNVDIYVLLKLEKFISKIIQFSRMLVIRFVCLSAFFWSLSTVFCFGQQSGTQLYFIY